jgi:hypothetical protein
MSVMGMLRQEAQLRPEKANVAGKRYFSEGKGHLA